MNTDQKRSSGYQSIVCCLCVWIGQSEVLAISLGDRVQTSANVNVRQTPAGMMIGSQVSGIHGTTVDGPTVATLNGTSYTWWKVDFASGTDGWVADIGLTAIVPAIPVLDSPGTGTSPGSTNATLTPTMMWTGVNGATGYGLYIFDVTLSKLVYNNESVVNTTSLVVPARTLTDGHSYRWNMRASDSAGFSGFSMVLYSHTEIPPSVAWVTTPPADLTIGQTFTVSWTYTG